MQACPVEVRESVVTAVLAQGWTWAQAVGTYGVSLASVGRFVAASRAGQASLAARPASGGWPKVLCLPEHVAALRASLEASPDLELSVFRAAISDDFRLHLLRVNFGA